MISLTSVWDNTSKRGLEKRYCMMILESIHHSSPFRNEDAEVQRSHLLAQGHMATKEALDEGQRGE